MPVRDKSGSASGTVMHLPERLGKVTFDNDGVAREINESQSEFLLTTFKDQFEEYHEPEGGEKEKFSGQVVIVVTTHAGQQLSRETVKIVNGVGTLAVMEPAHAPTSMGTVAREEHLAATLETTRTELAQALAANVELAKDNAELTAQNLSLEEAAKAPAKGAREHKEPERKEPAKSGPHADPEKK